MCEYLPENDYTIFKESKNMKNPTKQCSKCNNQMQKGRLYTISGNITDLKELFGYVNWEAVNMKKQYSGLFAYRCKKCGFLEFYSE